MTTGTAKKPAKVTPADLKKKVVLVGISDRMEIWDAQRWRAYEESGQDNFDRIAEGQL